MIGDYSHIKKVIKRYDHKNLNDMMSGPTTAENFAKTLFVVITLNDFPVVEVSVSETGSTRSIYRQDK